MLRRYLLVAVAVATLTACGPRSAPRGDQHLGDTHAVPDTASVPALSAAEAEKRFEAALDSGDAPMTVVLSNRFVSAGGVLDQTRIARVTEAIDRLAPDKLPWVWDELDAEAFPAKLVALRRALIARHLGDDDAALRWAERADGNDMAQRIADEVDRRRKVDPKMIAVMLPLSGEFSVLGTELRDGIALAAAGYRDIKIAWIDTAGQAVHAAAGVDQAVFDLNAVAIIGPVGEHESRAAAARAVELGIPIALLSPADGGASVADSVFRLWPSPQWEARQAAMAAIELGFDALAVAYPRDEHGRAAADAFAEQAKAGGARVVASQAYDPTATDLEPDLKRLLGLDPATNERLRRHLRRRGRKNGWKTFSPDVEFDLLYVPDDYDKAALVAAYMPFFNVELRDGDIVDTLALKRKHGGRLPSVVQLLGSSGWHHEGLIPRGGKPVEGALVLDVWSGSDNEEFSTEQASEFFTAFRNSTSRPPGAIAAQAYDAARLVFEAHGSVARSDDPRAAFAKQLATTRLDDGTCGPASIDRNGEIARQPILLRVDSGEFVLHEF